MSYLEHREFIEAEKLIDIAKFDEAIHLLTDFRKQSSISGKDRITYEILMSSAYVKMGKRKDMIELTEKSYQAIQGQENSLQKLDVYILKALSLIYQFKYDEALEFFLKINSMYKDLTQLPLNILLKRKADINWSMGLLYASKRMLNEALEYTEKSLKLRKDIDLKADIVLALSVIKEIYLISGEYDKSLDSVKQCLEYAKEIDFKRQIQYCYVTKGLIYTGRGEFETAIEYHKKALVIAEGLDDEFGIAASLNNLGYTYYQQGRFMLAQENLERSLKLFRNFGSPGYSSTDILFQIAIEKGDLETARDYLEQLKELTKKFDIDAIRLWYRVDKAIFLKASPRAIHRGKAEEMLKQLVDEQVRIYEIVIIALLHLCDILLSELHKTGDIEILDELKPYINKLLDYAEKNHSYLIQAESYILQARLALVTLDLRLARQFLIKAQDIAEKYHLNRLALKISNEHDELLRQLKIWEEIKESKASLNERLKLARLNEHMDFMLHRRVLTPLEIPDEDPVVILIVSESGEPIFSHLFDKEWSFEDHLIGGFITAINSFSDEMFAQGLDRATFGEFNLFMKPLSPYLVCYLYKGPTYLAKQRIQFFVECIQKDKDVWEIFNKYLKTSQLVQLKDVPTIEPLINGIFIEKTIQLDIF